MSSVKELNGTYVIDPAHSEIGFVARHAMITKVRGRFDEFEGTAVTGPDLSGAKVDVTIQAVSVDTNNEQRDGHLKTGDFFEVDKFPTITFTSTNVQAKGEDALAITGDLTIKGVTKSVTVDFEFGGEAKDPFGNERVGFEGKTEINRTDFGLNFNAALETGGVLVSEKITLTFDISAIKQG